MSDRHDIEETLRRFRHDTDARARDAVMSSYRDAFPGGAPPRRAGFWKRPIPLYAALAAVVVMVGLSFVAGRHLPGARGGQSGLPSAPTGETVTPAAADIEWTRAESDAL